MIGVISIGYNPDFDWTVLLQDALIGMVGIFIQACAEEQLFRGYFTQFARRFTKTPYLFIGIPALLFALAHITNVSELDGGLLEATPYLISGLFYAWAAYRTGSLWMAMYCHPQRLSRLKCQALQSSPCW